MSVFSVSAFLLSEQVRHKEEKIKRRVLRDHSNPLDIPDSVFISYYRLNKEAFQDILEDIEHLVKETSIPVALQLAATLRFLGEGGFQRSIGKDSDIALARSTVSKTLTTVLNVLERTLCRKWIKLAMVPEEVRKSKLHFTEKFRIPGVIGCIDGTHIKFVKPHQDEHLFFNRKGCFSLNAMIICDYNMCIRAVDACHPGASHDAFIFKLSSARQFFLSKYESGERGSWMLGDSGYGIEPFLLTPYRDPNAQTLQHRFNQQHSKARNIVERVIGVLKSRFRCLQTTLPYTPQKVVKIINICSALHNICRHYRLEDFEVEESEIWEDEFAEESSALQEAGQNIRNEIANSLIGFI